MKEKVMVNIGKQNLRSIWKEMATLMKTYGDGVDILNCFFLFPIKPKEWPMTNSSFNWLGYCMLLPLVEPRSFCSGDWLQLVIQQLCANPLGKGVHPLLVIGSRFIRCFLIVYFYEKKAKYDIRVSIGELYKTTSQVGILVCVTCTRHRKQR